MSGKDREKYHRDLVGNLFEFFFPQSCVFCKELVWDFLSYGAICETCRKSLGKENSGSYMEDVGYLKKLWYVGIYRSRLKDCVNRFKFFGEVTLGRFLGLMLFETILKGPTQFDSITYVPLHRKKIIKRGYNQAEVIAKILGEEMGVRKEKLLVKIKENPPQSSMGVDDRKRNVEGVFALSKFKKVPESVLIVDDIYTTGNTMGECARLLKESGVRNIYGGVLAIDYLL